MTIIRLGDTKPSIIQTDSIVLRWAVADSSEPVVIDFNSTQDRMTTLTLPSSSAVRRYVGSQRVISNEKRVSRQQGITDGMIA